MVKKEGTKGKNTSLRSKRGLKSNKMIPDGNSAFINSVFSYWARYLRLKEGTNGENTRF